MYTIYLDGDAGKYLYLPGDDIYAVDNIELELELGEAGSLKFDIFSTHPYYNEINPRETLVTVMKGPDRIFDGQVRELERNIDGTLNVYCVGELAYLYDTIQNQYEFHGAPNIYLRDLLNVHMAQETGNDYAIFHVGNVSIDDNYIYRFANYQPTIDVIREDLIEPFNVYPKFRRVGNWIYLDLLKLEEYTNGNNQAIEFGSNLMDYVESETVEDLYTAVLPLGRKKIDIERDAYDNPALDAYYTIREVNNGDLIVRNEDAIDQYGYVCALEQWEDIDIPETLKYTAEAWLNGAQYKTLSLTLKAIDLSMLQSQYDYFKLGDLVRCTASPLGIDITLPVTEMKIYPLKPEQNVLVIGSATPSLTRQTANVDENAPEGADTSISVWNTDYSFANLVPWSGSMTTEGPSYWGTDQATVQTVSFGAVSLKASGPEAGYKDFPLDIGSIPDFTYKLIFSITDYTDWVSSSSIVTSYTNYLEQLKNTTFKTFSSTGSYIESAAQPSPRIFSDDVLKVRGRPNASEAVINFSNIRAVAHTKILPWHVYKVPTTMNGTAERVMIDGEYGLMMSGVIKVRASLPWWDLEDKPNKLYAQFTVRRASLEGVRLVDENGNYIVDENGNYIGVPETTVSDDSPSLDIKWGNYTRTLYHKDLSVAPQRVTIDLSEGALETVRGYAINYYIQHITLYSRNVYDIYITDFKLYGDTDCKLNNPLSELWAF